MVGKGGSSSSLGRRRFRGDGEDHRSRGATAACGGRACGRRDAVGGGARDRPRQGHGASPSQRARRCRPGLPGSRDQALSPGRRPGSAGTLGAPAGLRGTRQTLPDPSGRANPGHRLRVRPRRRSRGLCRARDRLVSDPDLITRGRPFAPAGRRVRQPRAVRLPARPGDRRHHREKRHMVCALPRPLAQGAARQGRRNTPARLLVRRGQDCRRHECHRRCHPRRGRLPGGRAQPGGDYRQGFGSPRRPARAHACPRSRGARQGDGLSGGAATRAIGRRDKGS